MHQRQMVGGQRCTFGHTLTRLTLTLTPFPSPRSPPHPRDLWLPTEDPGQVPPRFRATNLLISHMSQVGAGGWARGRVMSARRGAHVEKSLHGRRPTYPNPGLPSLPHSKRVT